MKKSPRKKWMWCWRNDVVQLGGIIECCCASKRALFCLVESVIFMSIDSLWSRLKIGLPRHYAGIPLGLCSQVIMHRNDDAQETLVANQSSLLQCYCWWANKNIIYIIVNFVHDGHLVINGPPNVGIRIYIFLVTPLISCAIKVMTWVQFFA